MNPLPPKPSWTDQMSAHDDDIDEAAHPRETTVLFGHAAAEAALLAAYRSGRMPHAILIAGPKGIGKATLAYRIARFIFNHADPTANAVQNASSLQVESTSPVARRIAAQAQPDLLVIERTVNERGVLRNQIAVDDIRGTVPFFGSTAGEGGWRIAIIDAVDDLNRSGANALLKVLEEPPQRGLLLLIAHSTARVSPTLRSRCRILSLRPLAQQEVAAALAATASVSSDDPALAAAAAAADGSVARALTLLDEDALTLRQQAIELLSRLPAIDPADLHALGDALAGTDPQPLAAFLDAVNAWLGQRLDGGRGDLARLNRLAEASEHINAAVRDAEMYNLERKPLVFNVFGLLAEATRG
jgi:DNA polymerase III subunit delta'